MIQDGWGWESLWSWGLQAFWLVMPLMFIPGFSCHSVCVWWRRAVPVRDKLGMLGTGLKV